MKRFFLSPLVPSRLLVVALAMVAALTLPAEVSGKSCYNPPRFRIQSTATGTVVYDSVTALIWQQNISVASMFWPGAQALCVAPFRAPSVRELLTLVDFTVASPGRMIDATAFPGTPPTESFWTSSNPANSTLHYMVDFSSGQSFTNIFPTITGRIRCVR